MWICFCTAEVRGSNPLGSTLKMWIFAGKTLTRKKGRIEIQPFLTSRLQTQRLAVLCPFYLDASEPMEHVLAHVREDQPVAPELRSVVH